MLMKLVQASTLALFLVPGFAAAQSCDFSDLDCTAKGKKCNIHFENLTGIQDNSTCKKANTYASASTVKVRAKDDNGKTLGNTISMTAGQKNTMNLSNREDSSGNNKVTSLEMGDQGNFVGGDLTCDEIRQVLAGSGKCKIYHIRTGYYDIAPAGYAFFDCDGGKVCSAVPANAPFK
jgi:hypothetical protein